MSVLKRMMRVSNRSLLAFIFFFSLSSSCLYFIYVAPGIGKHRGTLPSHGSGKGSVACYLWDWEAVWYVPGPGRKHFISNETCHITRFGAWFWHVSFVNERLTNLKDCFKWTEQSAV